MTQPSAEERAKNISDLIWDRWVPGSFAFPISGAVLGRISAEITAAEQAARKAGALEALLAVMRDSERNPFALSDEIRRWESGEAK